MGDSTPVKPRKRQNVFHFSLGYWRRAELTAPTRSTCERQERLREEPASRRPQGLPELGRSGRRLRLYGAAEGRSAVGSPAEGEASWVWLSYGGRAGREGRGGAGEPSIQRWAGAGSGLRAGWAGSPTYVSSLSRPPDPVGVAFLGSELFPAWCRKLVGVQAEEPTASFA